MLSSAVMLLVSHSFLVQNQFYATQTRRTGAQDNVRAATELLAREVRTAMDGGLVLAGSHSLTVRSPIAVAGVCARVGMPNRVVFTEEGPGGFDEAAVAGIAARDPVTGSWEMAATTWSAIHGNDMNAARDCADNGADTTAVTGSFHRLQGLHTLFATVPDEGEVLMLYRETTFRIQTSQLDPGTLGLFRAAAGDSLVEFATGFDDSAQFQYRSAPTGVYADTVVAASLADIDAVRIVAEARKRAPTGGVDDITFGWSVTVPLRAVR